MIDCVTLVYHHPKKKGPHVQRLFIRKRAHERALRERKRYKRKYQKQLSIERWVACPEWEH